MPITYSLIASNTLTTSAASVTFSAIPNTFTDLVLRLSARSDTAADTRGIWITFNGVGGTSYSLTQIRGDGAAATSARTSNASDANAGFQNGNTSTANSFGSMEIYIPNYAGSTNKPLSVFSAQETNATTAYIESKAILFSNTGAISTIRLDPFANFVSGSSFFLYGIKNS